MRNFLDNLYVNFSTFMVGRYGFDEFNRALTFASLFFLVLSMFGLGFLSYVAFALIAYATFRSLSRNIDARMNENVKYLSFSKKPRAWWAQLNDRWIHRKTTAYITCPYCKKTFTVPKGKGKIRATCPHCHEQSVHKV